MEAKDVHVGDVLHIIGQCSFEIGPRGGVKEYHLSWAVTNKKTWKRDTERFDITIHRGLKGWEHLEYEYQLNKFVKHDDCPAVRASKKYYQKTETV